VRQIESSVPLFEEKQLIGGSELRDGDVKRVCPYGLKGVRIWTKEIILNFWSPPGQGGLMHSCFHGFHLVEETIEVVQNFCCSFGNLIWSSKQSCFRPSLNLRLATR
jgi:hypothetical protein